MIRNIFLDLDDTLLDFKAAVVTVAAPLEAVVQADAGDEIFVIFNF